MVPEPSSHNSCRTSRRRDAAILAVIAFLGLVIASLAFTHLDQPVVDLEKPWTEQPALAVALTIATWLGGWKLGPVVVVLLLIAARPHWRRLLKTLVVAYLFQVAVVKWLKLLVGRPRPRLIPDATVFEGFAHGRAFPSGHAAFAFMMAVIVSAWFPRWRWPVWAIAVWVAVSRVLVNAHFVSDIIVGAVIGAVAGAVTLWIWPPICEETREAIEREECARREARRSPTPEHHAAERRMALRVLTVVLFIGVALMAYWYVDPIGRIDGSGFLAHPWAIAIAEFGRLLGTWDLAPVLIAIAIIAAGCLWKKLLVSLLGGYLVQTTSTQLAKEVIGRPRPSQMDGSDIFFGPGSGYHSLPSGHASFIFMFAVICAAWFPRARYYLYALAVFVTLSRVALGA
ncbi:MAG: phosphatase PAP2 family protein, partial [Armatimonadota bacterium]